MMAVRACAALAAGLALAAGAAEAAVFTWTFRGVMTSGYDATGLFGVAGADLTGLHWTAVVRTNTAAPGAVIENGGVYTRIDGFGELTPVKVDFTLNGVSRRLGVPPQGPAFEINAGASGRQLQLDGVLPGFDFDEFLVIQASNSGSFVSGDLTRRFEEEIELLGAGVGLDFLPGPDFTTLPSLTAPPPGAFLGGSMTFHYSDFDRTTQVETVFYDAYGQMRILSITAGAVPEPATWATMIAGLGVAGAMARRRYRFGRNATSVLPPTCPNEA